MRASASAGCAGRKARAKAPTPRSTALGDVGLEPTSLRLARIAGTGPQALQAAIKLCELGHKLPGDAGDILKYRRVEPFGLFTGEPADGMLGAGGLADGQSRPEPRAARLDAVNCPNWGALGIPEAQHTAIERDTRWTSAEKPNEGRAGRAYRDDTW